MSTAASGLSDLRRLKVMHLFKLIDVNYNGYIDREDFRNLIFSLGSARPATETSGTYADLERAIMTLWEKISMMSDSSFDGRVDIEEWLKFFTHALSDELFYNNLIRPLETTLIDLIDTNGDGRISVSDYRDMALAVNVNESEISDIFLRMDTNRDGYITTDEAQTAIHQFFTSDDPAASGNWFFGGYTLN
jgi:Ca2+-binding EF-hand superfamily protein